ncbi:MAG: phosphoribosyl-AMP cyclohydrolase [Betaproteobacteria bacterium]|nr:phosphoribosyl-AMP cyclohydrolase [Betaproteobacteria bacterium]
MNDTLQSMWLAAVKWNEQGLVPAIAQDVTSKEVLMLAWMNRESLQLTLVSGDAHYWSRSRKQLWKKGETSGHIQHVKEIRLDCDGDTVLLLVEQVGGIACHTGRRRCFFNLLADGRWVVKGDEEPVLTSPGKFTTD